MKLFLILILITATAFRSVGQNILFLKSGEKMNGKVERFKNDTLTFIFKGNKMLFKSSVISSIYFEENEIPKEKTNVAQPTANISEQKEDGKISGVVTYFFNDNYGYKPDIGAQVLIIDITKISDFNIDIIDTFHSANTYKHLYDAYASIKKSKIPDDIKTEVKKYGVETQEGFDALDKRANEQLFKIKYNKITYCTKLTVDGNGTFSANLPLGKYYVLVTSSNRTGLSLTEIMGQISVQQIEVKSGQTSTMNAKFDVY